MISVHYHSDIIQIAIEAVVASSRAVHGLVTRRVVSKEDRADRSMDAQHRLPMRSVGRGWRKG